MNERIPVVILAGGRGARFDHESQVKPKPMIEVAGKPILEHIIDGFVAQGFKEFIVACGYLASHIEAWALRTALAKYPTDVTIQNVDTGVDSHTGERLLRLAPIIRNRRFILTYGDGLSDVDVHKVLERHVESVKGRVWWGNNPPDDPSPALITVTAVQPSGRFGAIEFVGPDSWDVGEVRSFQEKPREAWINGGFMVVEPEFIERYLWGPAPVPQLESQAMASCAADGFMRARKHNGYWRCMDTRRDLEQIEEDVRNAGGNLPWRRDMMNTDKEKSDE